MAPQVGSGGMEARETSSLLPPEPQCIGAFTAAPPNARTRASRRGSASGFPALKTDPQ